MRGIIDKDFAVRWLGDGGVVALPTDTVYGVAAAISHPSAVATLIALKHRPENVPLPVLVDSVDQIVHLGVEWPERARKLAEVFWPGALTIVVSVPRELADRVGSHDDTAGFRLPDDPLLRSVLARSGPLAVSSANRHGEPPCQSADDVLRAFGASDELEGVVDGGERSGTVSTVVDVSPSWWRVVREGSITEADLLAVIG